MKTTELGVLVFGTLFLAGLLATGIATGDTVATVAALAATGISYITQQLIVWEESEPISPSWLVLSCLAGMGLAVVLSVVGLAAVIF